MNYINYFEIYDGPGILSETIKVKNHSFCLSGYYAFIRERLTVDGEHFGIREWTMIMQNASFTWKGKLVDKPSIHCMQNTTKNKFHMWIRAQSYKALHCVWKFYLKNDKLYDYEEIHINRLNFRGHNFLSYYLSKDICHFGGLIVKTKSRSDRGSYYSYGTLFSLCENSYDTPLMIPRTMTDKMGYSINLVNILTELYIVFSSYYPYSKGFIDISFEVPSCKGFGYEIYTCLASGLPLAVQLNRARNAKWIEHSNIKGKASWVFGFDDVRYYLGPTEFPKCAKVWLLHNFNYFNRIYNPKNTACNSSDWQYTFQRVDTKIKRYMNTFTDELNILNEFNILNGNHKISVRHRVLPTIPYYGNTIIPNDHYNLQVELASIKSFPDDFTIKHQNLSVTNGNNIDIPLSHVISLTFKGNSSPHNMQATVTKVSLIHNTVCAELNSTPFRIDNYVVHLQLDGLFEKRREGYPEGDCNIFKTNLLCNISKSDTLSVDFLPAQPLLKFGVELGIALRGRSCVHNCRFNVSIWTNFKDKVLSLKATYLTSVKWTFRRMTASFRVQTNMSCYKQCAGYCNISVTFKPKLQLNNLNGLNATLSNSQNGSWKDAHEYCKSKGQTLITPKAGITLSDLFQHLIESQAVPCQKYYIGLYKTHKVCITNCRTGRRGLNIYNFSLWPILYHVVYM